MSLIKTLISLTLCIILIFPSVSIALEQNDNEDDVNSTPTKKIIQYPNKDPLSNHEKLNKISLSFKPNLLSSFFDSLALKTLNKIIHPLNNSPLDLKDESLDSLSYLSDSKIVGLGEATHGTKEFFQLKHRIFEYLVENHGYKIFAFECDMSESFIVDNFVTGGGGDIDYIMKEVMHFWTWKTEEVKDLLLWMKDYNKDKRDEDKIHFIGVDCQYLTYQVHAINYYFNKCNVSLPSECIPFLFEIDQIGLNLIDYYLNVSLEKKEEIDDNVDFLITKIEESKNKLISNSTEFEFKFIKRIALNIKQVNNVCYEKLNNLVAQHRDFYMAENTLWATDLFGGDTKVALWAHNGHLHNSNGKIGYHLKKELKEDYQIIGFAFSQGNFTASKWEDLATIHLERKPLQGSINNLLHQAKYKNFILKIGDIPKISFLNIWTWKPRGFLTIGSVYYCNLSQILYNLVYYPKIFLKRNYDVIINWDKTTAAEQLT